MNFHDPGSLIHFAIKHHPIRSKCCPLYPGPWSDLGRKPILLLPFIGHVLSGIVPLLVLYFETWPPTVLYLTNVYQFFGGYTLLSIAMNGYVGDVTTPRYVRQCRQILHADIRWRTYMYSIFSERTTLYAVLSGVGIVFFPLMEFVGGQLYKYTGFYGVFGTSLGFTVAGIAYIVVIPETVTKRRVLARCFQYKRERRQNKNIF